MAILEQLQKDMVAAMKAKDEARLSAIRMIKAALMKEKVDSMKELDEAAELKVLSSLVKQRREAAAMFREGGRSEQAEKEEAELKLVESYMPAAASPEEMDAALESVLAGMPGATVKDMGKVMAAVKAALAGKRADGKALSEKVKARLA